MGGDISKERAGDKRGAKEGEDDMGRGKTAWTKARLGPGGEDKRWTSAHLESGRGERAWTNSHIEPAGRRAGQEPNVARAPGPNGAADSRDTADADGVDALWRNYPPILKFRPRHHQRLRIRTDIGVASSLCSTCISRFTSCTDSHSASLFAAGPAEKPDPIVRLPRNTLVTPIVRLRSARPPAVIKPPLTTKSLPLLGYPADIKVSLPTFPSAAAPVVTTPRSNETRLPPGRASPSTLQGPNLRPLNNPRVPGGGLPPRAPRDGFEEFSVSASGRNG